ncbi:MAG: hypothetical protein JWM68_2778 [Verrucomicrobiales bacterium]|nr:hypothetical protein [Verrucomicrobiales bacterium]
MLVVVVGIEIHEARQISEQQGQIHLFAQKQSPLAGQVQQLTRERDDFARQLATLRNENERLNRDTGELLKLRGEVARLRTASRTIAGANEPDKNDPTEIDTQSWLNRVKLLRQRFDQWPGKKTPELALLTEQDWLRETENRKLETDEDCREAMSKLRYHAKEKLAGLVNKSLEEYSKANNEQLPSDLSQLKRYLNPPVDSLLDGYEIAKPGTVPIFFPNSPNADRALKWAIVAKGSHTPGADPQESYADVLADKEYDTFIVIYQGGYYGYGPEKTREGK